MKKTIAVLSGKGGVGKSSISAMIAKIISLSKKTAILDFDICGPSISTAFNIKEGGLIKTENGFTPININNNLHILSFGSILKPKDAVIWRGPKKQIFLNLFYNSVEDYEYVIIDTPPGISEEHNFLINKDISVIIVTTPQNIALNDTQRCIEFCQENKMNIIGIVENMSWLKCECCEKIQYPFGSKGGKLLAEEYQLDFIGELEIEPEWSVSLDDGSFENKFTAFKAYGFFRQALIKYGIIENTQENI